jgi:hypothetical protein
MASDTDDFVKAIREGDLGFLRDYLSRHPGALGALIKWNNGSNDGYPMNCAAYHDRPDVIELFAQAGAGPDRNEGVSCRWTPLHHAENQKALKAAAALLMHGADCSIRNESSKDTSEFCRSEKIQQLRDPQYREKLAQKARAEKQKKIDGSWKLTGPREVVHDHELPDSGWRMTDIFNFETRCWRACLRDAEHKGVTQNIVFFDDIPDTQILRHALGKLKELGGDADESAIEGGHVIKGPMLKRGL